MNLSPALLTTLASLVCAVFGISDAGMQADVKSVLAAAAALVVAVYTWQHHRTIRNADKLSAQLQSQKISADLQGKLAVVNATPPAPAVTVSQPPAHVPEATQFDAPVPMTTPTPGANVAGHQVSLGAPAQG